MVDSLNRIDSWRRVLRGGAEHAVATLHEAVESLPLAERERAISYAVPPDALRASFEQATGNAERPLAGIPVWLKDLYDIAGVPTHCSSTFLSEERPLPGRSGALAQALEENGTVLAGKTHMNEFAYGLDGLNPHYGDCPHPEHPERAAGGSSSGSAWVVAKGLSPLAFGTDTAGSIRVPAAYCGLFGYRLTPGDPWISEGAFPLAPSYDTAGWFTAHGEDMITVISSLLSTQPHRSPVRGIYLDELDVRYDETLLHRYRNTAQKLGLTTRSPHIPVLQEVFSHAVKTFSVLQSREAYDIHKQWHGPLKDRYDPNVWKLLARGPRWTEEEVVEATRRQEEIRDAFAGLFVDFDYLAVPVSPHVAPPRDGITLDSRQDLLALTVPASLARLPVLTIPVDRGDGLTGGIQIIFRNTYSAVPLQVLEELAGLTRFA